MLTRVAASSVPSFTVAHRVRATCQGEGKSVGSQTSRLAMMAHRAIKQAKKIDLLSTLFILIILLFIHARVPGLHGMRYLLRHPRHVHVVDVAGASKDD